jgi:drug/metabolite transporter (DMT)-like permease
MQTEITPYIFAILANLAFASASIIFVQFSKLYSPMWMNQLKVTVAMACFPVAFYFYESWSPLNVIGGGSLLLSGFLGLCIGDFFLFRSFSTLGATRTLMLYSFQPIIMAIYGFLILNQNLSLQQWLAILCMMSCLFVFVIERKQQLGTWNVLAFAGAFLGIIFDTVGVMLTRTAFDSSPNLGSFQANSIRAAGALAGFFLIKPKSFVFLIKDLIQLKNQTEGRKKLIWVLSACFFGTFLSLSLYLRAVKTAHVATLTAITITGPIWVSLIEHIQSRSLPNRYLVTAFSLFVIGFALLTF